MIGLWATPNESTWMWKHSPFIILGSILNGLLNQLDLAWVMNLRSSMVKVFRLTLCKIFLTTEKSQFYLSFSLRLKVLTGNEFPAMFSLLQGGAIFNGNRGLLLLHDYLPKQPGCRRLYGVYGWKKIAALWNITLPVKETNKWKFSLASQAEWTCSSINMTKVFYRKF